jgi:hypothetical protein
MNIIDSNHISEMTPPRNIVMCSLLSVLWFSKFVGVFPIKLNFNNNGCIKIQKSEVTYFYSNAILLYFYFYIILNFYSLQYL